MINNFNDFNPSEGILKAIVEMGFEEPSPIQKASYSHNVALNNGIAVKHKRVGKTASFGIPIVEKVNKNLKSTQAMVLCPTRELSIQSCRRNFKTFKVQRISVVPIYGGQPIEEQIRSLKMGVHVVVGTPGRVIDHIKRKTLKTDDIENFCFR